MEHIIKRFGIRGFDHYKEIWSPKKRELLDCVVSGSNSVNVVNGEQNVVGSVPTEFQKVSREFINKKGKIQAKVKEEVPVCGTKGNEIPCEFIWTGPKTPSIENAIKAAKKVEKELKDQTKKESKSKVKSSNKRKSKEKSEGSCKKLPKTELLKKSKPESTRSTSSNTMSASGDKGLLQEDIKQEAFKRNREDEKLDNSSNGTRLNASSLDSTQFFGAFIDTHGHVESMLESEAKVTVSRSVCKIHFPIIGGSGTATGFRVGSKYVMTAAHVTNQFLEGIHYAGETFVVFNYKHDGIYREDDKYLIKEVVYSDAETDIAVIELLDHSLGMPPHVTNFHPPIIGRGFNLIGHSQGNAMEANFVRIIFNKEDEKFKLSLNELQKKSKQLTNGIGYDSPPYNTVLNPCRFLFQCKFTKGASGAPGVVCIGGQVYVTTVLLCGYPSWYYNPSTVEFKKGWRDDQCVQQGANIMSVRDRMRGTNPVLCQDIFGI